MTEVKLENLIQEPNVQARCIKGLFIHDISNLFHILGNSFELCELLVKEGTKNVDILEYFKLIREQLNRGKKLVKNLQRFSELEESGMPLEPIDLFKNLRNAGKFIKITFPKRNVDIKVYYEADEEIYVLANELLLDVFENILMNSVVYNKSEVVQIEVSITEVNAFDKLFVKLEIKDNGIGIEDSRKAEILQENHRKSYNSKGMGLGLSVVAKFISLCKGKIWIEDRIVGDCSKGSNFVILIPRVIQQNLLYYAYQEKFS